MEAVGPEFRPVSGGMPEQTNKQSGAMDQVSGMIGGGKGFGGMMGGQGSGQASQNAGQAAQGAQSAVSNVGSTFSDSRCKEGVRETDWVSDYMNRLSKLSGYADGGYVTDERIKEPTEESPDMVEEVAENMGNYLYHYKPGSGEDPSVEYSGPMAQELLQVDGYRSAVFEDESGLLQVDTGRIAMVNAGMIADLSKRILFLENFIRTIMENFSGMAEEAPAEQMADVE